MRGSSVAGQVPDLVDLGGGASHAAAAQAVLFDSRFLALVAQKLKPSRFIHEPPVARLLLEAFSDLAPSKPQARKAVLGHGLVVRVQTGLDSIPVQRVAIPQGSVYDD